MPGNNFIAGYIGTKCVMTTKLRIQYSNHMITLSSTEAKALQTSPDDMLRSLENLTALFEKGLLSPEEFALAKSKLLAR